MNRHKRPLREQPANFWIGVGLVAEAPIALFQALAPEGSCKALLGWAVECPPPLALVLAVCFLLFVVTAGLAYLFGFAAGEDGERNNGNQAQSRSKLSVALVIFLILGVAVRLFRMRIVT